jgi:hypothetical protein
VVVLPAVVLACAMREDLVQTCMFASTSESIADMVDSLSKAAAYLLVCEAMRQLPVGQQALRLQLWPDYARCIHYCVCECTVPQRFKHQGLSVLVWNVCVCKMLQSSKGASNATD